MSRINPRYADLITPGTPRINMEARIASARLEVARAFEREVCAYLASQGFRTADERVAAARTCRFTIVREPHPDPEVVWRESLYDGEERVVEVTWSTVRDGLVAEVTPATCRVVRHNPGAEALQAAEFHRLTDHLEWVGDDDEHGAAIYRDPQRGMHVWFGYTLGREVV